MNPHYKYTMIGWLFLFVLLAGYIAVRAEDTCDVAYRERTTDCLTSNEEGFEAQEGYESCMYSASMYKGIITNQVFVGLAYRLLFAWCGVLILWVRYLNYQVE